MNEAVERIVNLALFLSHARHPVTAEQIRAEVIGYPEDQDDKAFARMFERDKDELRSSGFCLLFDEEKQEYSLDRSATFAAPIDLTAEEAAVVRTAGTAVLEDPSFPFSASLRLAIAKIAAELPTEAAPAAARLADEDPKRQGAAVATLSDAAERRKTVHFAYTNSLGKSAPHDIEPYGLFTHDGRWYLVGRDTALDEVRTYAAARMKSVKVNSAAPKSPDFERPAGFDVARFIMLPFQYGPDGDEFIATVRFDEQSAWRATSLARGQGELEPQDNAVLWRVKARSPHALARFVVENGPGIELLGPEEACAGLAAGLNRVVAAHG